MNEKSKKKKHSQTNEIVKMEECDITSGFFFKVRESMNWQKKNKKSVKGKKRWKKNIHAFPK